MLFLLKIAILKKMKKLSLYIFLVLIFLSSCSEEKKQTKEIKEENKYLKSSMMKKLGNIDQIYMEEMMDKLVKGEIDDLSLLMMFYTHTGTSMIVCDAMVEVYSKTDSKIRTKQSEEECKIYREIYEKYNSMYQKIIDTNSIPAYFYFDLKEDGSESNSSIGIFPTKKECEYYSNLFREKNIGLTSNCKKGFSST